jgi:D-serine deaminase-like pyridoxal phosphate-dependent protein
MTNKMTRRGFMSSSLGGAVGMSLSAKARTASGSESLPLPDAKTIWELPTPALLVDLEAMEANLKKMADFYRPKKAKLRPHGKTHKCPILAKKQIELGAVGVCAAKVSEAEAFVEGGVENVLVTSPVVTPEKFERLLALARKSPGIRIVVDQPAGTRALDQAAAAAGVKLSVLIDLNVGSDRTGIEPGRPALELARTIAKSASLVFGGIQAYAGHVMHRRGFEYRKQSSLKALAGAIETKRLLEKDGFEVPVLSVGGTGTYNIDCDVPEITDVQVGSYLFMDVNYRNVGGAGGPIFDDFRPSLLVLATAISQPVGGRITIDAGYKAFATDQEPPDLLNVGGVSYRWGGDEHGILEFKAPSREIRLGDKLLLIASHCDPTVNLYDRFYAFRNERVEEVWPIAGRGRSQ